MIVVTSLSSYQSCNDRCLQTVQFQNQVNFNFIITSNILYIRQLLFIFCDVSEANH